MKDTTLLLLILFLCSCSKKDIKQEEPSQNSITDTTSISGVLLELENNKGISKLIVKSDKYKVIGALKTTAPSHFLKRNNKILSFSYPEIKVDHTIIVQGRFGIQGILFKQDSIIITDYKTVDSKYNIQEGADEKVYWEFAHQNKK